MGHRVARVFRPAPRLWRVATACGVSYLYLTNRSTPIGLDAPLLLHHAQEELRREAGDDNDGFELRMTDDRGKVSQPGSTERRSMIVSPNCGSSFCWVIALRRVRTAGLSGSSTVVLRLRPLVGRWSGQAVCGWLGRCTAACRLAHAGSHGQR